MQSVLIHAKFVRNEKKFFIFDTRAKRPSGIKEQNTLHEKGGPLTSILMNREVKVGPGVKVIAETSAYRTEVSP